MQQTRPITNTAIRHTFELRGIKHAHIDAVEFDDGVLVVHIKAKLSSDVMPNHLSSGHIFETIKNSLNYQFPGVTFVISLTIPNALVTTIKGT